VQIAKPRFAFILPAPCFQPVVALAEVALENRARGISDFHCSRECAGPESNVEWHRGLAPNELLRAEKPPGLKFSGLARAE
jgi:hypothetical protein